MAKLHTHYVTNAKSELKFAYNAFSEEEFQNEVLNALSNPCFFNEDDDDGDDIDDDSDYDEDEDNNQDEGTNSDDDNAIRRIRNRSTLEISRWVNITDRELQELLQTEVNVVIDVPPPPQVNHGSTEFNMEEVLDKVLT
jgi:hypothetical protein